MRRRLIWLGTFISLVFLYIALQGIDFKSFCATSNKRTQPGSSPA